MKKLFFLLLFILLSVYISSGDTYLRLRASHHPGYLRIVLEGQGSVISKAIVNQRRQNILVTFPEASFTVQAEKMVVAYRKIGRDAIMFFPGNFRGLKVFTLKYPDRLVIDVYLDEETKREKRKPASLRIKTIIIDPGHGGYEHGLISGNYREKNVVLDIAKKLKALIGRGLSSSFLTRGSDRFMPLAERIKFANSKNTEVFLSLHIGNHKEIVLYVPVITEYVPDDVKPFLVNRGQERFIAKTVKLLNAMKEAIASDFGDDMVSVKPLPYSILSKIEAAALMVELPSFEDAYYIEEFKTEIANTLYKGLYIYEEISSE